MSFASNLPALINNHNLVPPMPFKKQKKPHPLSLPPLINTPPTPLWKGEKVETQAPTLIKAKPPSLYSLKEEHIPLPRKCPAKVR